MRRFFTEVTSGRGRVARPTPRRADDPPVVEQVHAVCPACFWVGRPRPVARGSAIVESLLWAAGIGSAAGFLSGVTLPVLFLLLLAGPGYSVWRHSRRTPACRQCGTYTLIPEDVACPPAPAHFLFSTQPARGAGRAPRNVPAAARPALSAAEK